MAFSFILLVALAVMPLLRHRSADLRHWVLTGALFCGAVAPLLRPLAPAWSVGFRPAPAVQLPAARSSSRDTAIQIAGTTGPASQVSPAAAKRLTFGDVLSIAGDWLSVGWAAGAAVSLCLLLVGFVRLRRLSSSAVRLPEGPAVRLVSELSRTMGLTRPVTLMQGDAPNLPITWGFARPAIMIPADRREWSDERLRVVLLHELAHIRRGDWLTQLATECVRAVYWFNPLVWIVAGRLRQESEQACDNAVLNGGIGAPDYASHLLAIAESAAARRAAFLPDCSAPAMARPSSLERRFTVMLNTRVDRHPVTSRARVAATLALLVVTVFVAGFGAQTFSTFSGFVVDETNRPVPAVIMTLVNTESQARHDVQTDSSGRFEFVGLPPADYTWETALAGFATLRGKLAVAGRDVQQDLVLQVGMLEETVTIRGGDPSRQPTAADPNKVDNTRREPTEPCVAGPTGGTIKPPVKISDTVVRYPDQLSASGVGGVVILNVLIDTRGEVSDVSVLRSPNPDLEFAAVEAVRQWKYSVTTLNCTPVEIHMNVTVAFASQP